MARNVLLYRSGRLRPPWAEGHGYWVYQYCKRPLLLPLYRDMWKGFLRFVDMVVVAKLYPTQHTTYQGL